MIIIIKVLIVIMIKKTHPLIIMMLPEEDRQHIQIARCRVQSTIFLIQRNDIIVIEHYLLIVFFSRLSCSHLYQESICTLVYLYLIQFVLFSAHFLAKRSGLPSIPSIIKMFLIMVWLKMLFQFFPEVYRLKYFFYL